MLMQEEQTPGGVIRPQGSDQPKTTPPEGQSVAAPPAEPPMTAPVAVAQEQPDLSAPQYESNFGQTEEPVVWTASEYIAHTKSVGWYVGLGAAAAVLTVIVFFFTHGDIISSLAVLIMSILFGVVAGRQPREQRYVLDDEGVHVGTKVYNYGAIKSFSVYDEPPFSSISFMPMKRFMPMISVYYDPADEQKIVEYLSTRLPLEYRKRDAIDRLMHKIRF